jgi:hypothetical protein
MKICLFVICSCELYECGALFLVFLLCASGKVDNNRGTFQSEIRSFVKKRSIICEEIKGIRSYLVLQGKSLKEVKQVQKPRLLWKIRLRRTNLRARELCVFLTLILLESSPVANISRAREI